MSEQSPARGGAAVPAVGAGATTTVGAGDTTTVGVAIDIPEPYAGQLRQWRYRSGDPLAAQVPPHVTLLPPTPVPAGSLPRIAEHLAGVAAGSAAFEMHLRGTGTFRPVSEVVFVAVAAGISHCEQLESQVRSGPLARTTQFTYHPHVTVAHGVAPEMLDLVYAGLEEFDARFKVAEFTMFTQDGGGNWRPERTFSLGG